MKLAIIFMLALSAFSEMVPEPHFFIKMPLRAKIVEGLNLPGDEAVRDVLMINVRIQSPEAFRIRTFLTVKLPSGEEVTYERDVRIKSGDIWSTSAFSEEHILDSEFVRIRFKEEPEPPALAESVSEAPKPQ